MVEGGAHLMVEGQGAERWGTPSESRGQLAGVWQLYGARGV